jgi:hypothetical protein
MVPALVRLIRFVSIAVCVIVAVSFGIFAIDQTNTASHHQRETLAETSTPSTAGTGHENSLHRAIDDAAAKLTSPFSSLVSANSGEWASRGVKLLLTLLVYGFGLGYLARAIRVRV